MTDFALANIDGLPVSVACLGLLYQKSDGMIGQQRGGKASLNLIDLSLLPLTPIMVNTRPPTFLTFSLPPYTHSFASSFPFRVTAQHPCSHRR